jgi:hypothetical protein
MMSSGGVGPGWDFGTVLECTVMYCTVLPGLKPLKNYKKIIKYLFSLMSLKNLNFVFEFTPLLLGFNFWFFILIFPYYETLEIFCKVVVTHCTVLYQFVLISAPC